MGKKPAKFALEGKNWTIVIFLHDIYNLLALNLSQEYQEDESNLIVDQCELNQAVNLFGCKNTTVQIKGKVNAVTLGTYLNCLILRPSRTDMYAVNCVKTSVLVDSVVSSVSITKSPSFALQIVGKAPMIQIDSTDSGQIYLSKTSLEAEITTAKCSAINVSLPVEGEEDGVFVEQAVPEMLRTVVKDGKLVTSVLEHTG